MGESNRGTVFGKLMALLLLALLVAAPAFAGGDGPLTPAEKAARLASLRAEFRAEVAKSGFDSEKAKELRAEITKLEGTDAVEPGAAGSSTPSTPPTGGTESKPPSNPAEHMVPGIDKVPDYVSKEGVGNPCGAYAVATVLNSFGDNVKFQDVFDSIVPIKFGTSPHDLKDYLMDHGHQVNDRNNGSLEDIASAVDRGERIIMILNVSSGLEGLHYAAVKGYRIKNGKRYWVFEDTYYGSSKELTDEELAKAWKEPVLDSALGYNNYYMTVGKDGPNLFDRVKEAFYGMNDRTPAEVVTSGLRDVTRGAADTFGSGRSVGDRVGGFFHMVGGGALKVVAGGVFGAVAIGGHYVEKAGDAMMGWGADQWKNGGFFGKIAGAGATVLGAITKGVGWVISTVGEIFSGICGAIGDAIGAIGDAIGDGIDAVGDFFGGLF